MSNLSEVKTFTMSFIAVLLVAMLTVGAYLGFLFTMGICESHQTIIKHGAAHYDTKTGAFVWNDEVKP